MNKVIIDGVEWIRLPMCKLPMIIYASALKNACFVL